MPPKKRGRKPKKTKEPKNEVKKVHKKRGRKPKGGKIIKKVNIYRKKFTLDDNEQEFLNSISNIIMLFNASLFHLLQKERLKYEKKESIIHFAVGKSVSIIDKLFPAFIY